MHESHPRAGDGGRDDEEIERAIAEFMRATDSFIASWSDSIRRFADEPSALRQLREAREAASPRRTDGRTSPAFENLPTVAAFSHPLWDRELDG
jgi:hypothetical protein